MKLIADRKGEYAGKVYASVLDECARLEAENYDLRHKLQAMHRRAQKAESIQIWLSQYFEFWLDIYTQKGTVTVLPSDNLHRLAIIASQAIRKVLRREPCSGRSIDVSGRQALKGADK